MNAGFVYVMLNPAFPTMVKIGKTGKAPSKRARQLSRETGVPNDFIVLFDCLVSDITSVENEMHESLSEYRIKVRRKEFFSISPKIAISTLIDISRKYPTDSLSDDQFVDDLLPFFQKRFPKCIDKNIFSIRLITVPGSCYLRVGRRLGSEKIFSDEEIPLCGLQVPDPVTPEAIEHNARELTALDEYDWIMVSNLFPLPIAQKIANEWEEPGGKLDQRRSANT